jgi:hypothetical protein
MRVRVSRKVIMGGIVSSDITTHNIILCAGLAFFFFLFLFFLFDFDPNPSPPFPLFDLSLLKRSSKFLSPWGGKDLVSLAFNLVFSSITFV